MDLAGGDINEKLQQLVDNVRPIERGFAYEKRGMKTQRQGEIFKKVHDNLREYFDAQDATE